jgi:hypothetical protein
MFFPISIFNITQMRFFDDYMRADVRFEPGMPGVKK